MTQQSTQDGPSLAGQPAAQAPATTSTTASAPGTTAAPGARPQPAPGGELFYVLLPVLVGMVLLQVFSARKQRKQKERLLADLKKHDRVVTTGGMIGFVAEVKPDVVVLKLEEGRDTRVTFTRDAIAAVVKSAEPAAADSGKSDS
jgi:preprotein translocase subunit YajC